MKKVLVSCGPIPAKLDLVKFITNRFKGGLALETAERLAFGPNRFDVVVVKWFGTELKTHLPTINVNDVHDYYDTIKNTPADAYILAGAIANLVPVNPWVGKFPSHFYKEGDKFNIEFTIAPRAIDKVKIWHPRSTLIGYKLFDGSEDELMKAAWHTLVDSRSNVVFANHPATAKTEKIAIMPDGTSLKISFDEHVEFIRRIINLNWYKTKTEQRWPVSDAQNIDLLSSLLSKIAVKKGEYSFGTVAIKYADNSFLTTTRGKRESGHCCVYGVDDASQTVVASAKATLNAPTLNKLFTCNPDTKYIIHGHRQLKNVLTMPYAFSGTTEEVQLAEKCGREFPIFNVFGHGYYACFNNLQHMKWWVDDKYPNQLANVS